MLVTTNAWYIFFDLFYYWKLKIFIIYLFEEKGRVMKASESSEKKKKSTGRKKTKFSKILDYFFISTHHTYDLIGF